MKQARPQFDFCCIHFGRDTVNKRQLEKHVEYDEEENITSWRKQEATSINARNCPYLVYLAYKQIGKRGSGKYGLELGVSNDTHTHVMAVNPLRYRKEHVKALPIFLSAVELSKSLRSVNILYLKAL